MNPKCKIVIILLVIFLNIWVFYRVISPLQTNITYDGSNIFLNSSPLSVSEFNNNRMLIEYLHVIAKIDGMDWFELKGNKWRWQHGLYEVPETHLNNETDEIFPTIVNGEEFLSSWPNGIDYLSYSEEHIIPGLQPIELAYGSDVEILMEVIRAREGISLDQKPKAENNYTLRVFLNDENEGGSDIYEFKIHVIFRYRNHDPILIEGDADFIGYPGSGTIEDPFLIENLNISSDNPLITISNTTVFFQIRNNLLDGLNSSSGGIIFSNVSGGVIEGNLISDFTGNGITLNYSTNIVITTNNVSHTSTGIILANISVNNTISNNIISGNNKFGVSVNRSCNNILNNNSIKNNSYGIFLINSDNNTVTSNSISNNTVFGIEINETSTNNTVKWNNFINNSLFGNQQGSDNGINSKFIFNYWNDLIGFDNDNNGFLDLPYDINGTSNNQDSTPLAINHILEFFTILAPSKEEYVIFIAIFKWIPPKDSYNHSITYSILYNTVNTNNWIKIASGINNTVYNWDLPDFADDTIIYFRVVATCSEGLIVGITSTHSFTVKNEELTKPTILYPNGGEYIRSNTLNIEWTASIDYLNHSITYSVFASSNIGSNWYSLAHDIDTTTYRWYISENADRGSNYLIKVVATCSEGETNEDLSDKTFLLLKPIPTNPWSTLINGLSVLGFFVVIILIYIGPTIIKYFLGSEKKSQSSTPTPSRSATSRICPKCKFSNRAMSTECSFCGFAFPSIIDSTVIEKPIQTIITKSEKLTPNQQPSLVSSLEPNPLLEKPRFVTEPMVFEDLFKFFSLFLYKVQDIKEKPSEEGSVVQLIPYYGSIEEILVAFHQNQFTMYGSMNYQQRIQMNLEMKVKGLSKQTILVDPWEDVTLTGNHDIITQIKHHTKIAELLISLGKADVKVNSLSNFDVKIEISSATNKRGVAQAYSLLTEIQSFIDRI